MGKVFKFIASTIEVLCIVVAVSVALLILFVVGIAINMFGVIIDALLIVVFVILFIYVVYTIKKERTNRNDKGI